MAGFSEYDAFRSQQIRKGLITRDEGMKLVQIDNNPDLFLLKEFCLLVGINFEETLSIVNSAPKLY